MTGSRNLGYGLLCDLIWGLAIRSGYWDISVWER